MKYKYANVDGLKVEACPGEHGHCTFCGSEMIAKCGELNVWHWAHKSKEVCDIFSENETPWHREWKDGIPADQCEVTIIREGTRHQADIVTHDGIVVEVQHSPISVAKIRKREEFYGKMVWILDLTEKGYDLSFSKQLEHNFYNFHWTYARRSFASARKPIFLDLGPNWSPRELGSGHWLFQITRWPHVSVRSGEGVFLKAEEIRNRVLKGHIPDFSELYSHFDDRVCPNCIFNGTEDCPYDGQKSGWPVNMGCSNWEKVADEHFHYIQ